AAGDPNINLPQCLSGRYGEDPFFRSLLANPKAFPNFLVSDGLVFVQESDRRILCIPDVKIGARRVHEIIISHAHLL
ncbi:hypothetical protein BD410DRAFT_698745, partial [Rickenella mellea]